MHLGGETAVKKDIQDGGVLRDVLATEAERIVKRKDGDEKAAVYVAAAVKKFDHKKNTVETLSSELIIAAEIAKVQEAAT